MRHRVQHRAAGSVLCHLPACLLACLPAGKEKGAFPTRLVLAAFMLWFVGVEGCELHSCEQAFRWCRYGLWEEMQ